MPRQMDSTMVRCVFVVHALVADRHQQLSLSSSSPHSLDIFYLTCQCFASASMYQGLAQCLGDRVAQWYASRLFNVHASLTLFASSQDSTP